MLFFLVSRQHIQLNFCSLFKVFFQISFWNWKNLQTCKPFLIILRSELLTVCLSILLKLKWIWFVRFFSHDYQQIEITGFVWLILFSDKNYRSKLAIHKFWFRTSKLKVFAFPLREIFLKNDISYLLRIQMDFCAFSLKNREFRASFIKDGLKIFTQH